MIAKWQMKAEINPAKTIQSILFRKPDDAIKQLQKGFPIDENVSIMANPNWWPRLPILPFRINLIEIQ
jgi:hypothetical protein